MPVNSAAWVTTCSIPRRTGTASSRNRAFYLRLDIPVLLESDGVVLLPGWRASRGASLEVWLAVDLGMPIYECVAVDEMVVLERIEPPPLNVLPFEIGERSRSLLTE